MQYMKWLDDKRTRPDLDFAGHAENNSILLRMGGVTLLHMGDNNDSGDLPWAVAKRNQGWNVDIVLYFAKSRTRSADMRKLWPKALLAKAHDHEFTHSWAPFNQGAFDYKLVWGEIVRFEMPEN